MRKKHPQRVTTQRNFSEKMWNEILICATMGAIFNSVLPYELMELMELQQHYALQLSVRTLRSSGQSNSLSLNQTLDISHLFQLSKTPHRCRSRLLQTNITYYSLLLTIFTLLDFLPARQPLVSLVHFRDFKLP